MHKTICILLLLATGANSCTQPNNETQNSTHQSTMTLTTDSIVAVLPYTPQFQPLLPNAKDTVSLNERELADIDKIVNACITEYNGYQSREYELMIQHGSAPIDKSDMLIQLSKYKRQYIAFINDKNEKEIWVNCFCDQLYDSKWRKELVLVKDGGNCYFNLKVNLTSYSYYNLSVNGEA